MNHKNETPLFSLTIGEFRTLLQDEALLSRANNSSDKSSGHDPNKILTITEAAEFLQISKATLYAMNCQNRIPFIKTSGKVYYRLSSLQNWLTKGEQAVVEQSTSRNVGGFKR